MALSRVAPLINPLARRASTSLANPKVRAGASSRAKRRGVHFIGARLASDQRVREFHGDGEAVGLGGRDDVARLALGHGEGRLHREDYRLSVDVHRPRLGQRREIGRHTPVENGRLRPRQLDQAVVDLVGGQGGHQVLDRVNGHRPMADGGAALERVDLGEAGRDLRALGQVHPAEHDALPRGGGQKPGLGARPGMQAHAGDLDRSGDGTSREWAHGPGSPVFRVR